jgi:hypothetical protein
MLAPIMEVIEFIMPAVRSQQSVISDQGGPLYWVLITDY